MESLIDELLAIMDNECKGYEKWENSKPIIVNVYIGGDK